MGLHIYSGSLVRLFTNNWENEIQRVARENGWEYENAYPDGEPNWPNKETATEHVRRMRDTLLSQPGVTDSNVGWADNDLEPYKTIKFHDEAREAIAIVAAHLQRPDLPMPDRMPKTSRDDAAYAEARSKGYLLDALAPLESSLVIPGTFASLAMIEDPLRERRLTCSTARLRASLSDLQRRFWDGRVQPEAWLDRGLVFARNASSSTKVGNKWIHLHESEPENSLRGNAEFAFAVLSAMLAFSDLHRTPIVTTW